MRRNYWHKISFVCGLGLLMVFLVLSQVEAAWLTGLSNTMSNQVASVLSNHSLSFVTRTGVANGQTLILSFESAFDTSSVDFTDIDLAVGGTDRTMAANCLGAEEMSVVVAGDVFTFTVCNGDGGAIPSGSTVTIEIGTNATAGTTGDQQIRNPGSAGSYDITIGGSFSGAAKDRGNIAVAIESVGSVSVSVVVPPSGGSGGNQPSGGDATIPTISNVVVTDITRNSARVTWQTNEDSDSEVDYGVTASYEIGTAVSVALTTNHSVLLSGLSAATTYHFRVRSADASNNEASSVDYTFTTASLPDTTAPIISDVQAINITPTSATIAWSTNEMATSVVEYGLTNVYELGDAETVGLALDHEVGLSGLISQTFYHFRVRSSDVSSNEAVSGDYIFTTASPPDITAPIISNLRVVDITETSARVTWQTNESASSEISYGPTTSYENGTITEVVLVTDHSLSLDSLLPATEYHFVARSRDAASNLVTSNDRTFTTLPDRTSPPNVSDFQANELSPREVTLTWRNPPDPDLAGVRIVRRSDRFPTGPTDGAIIFDQLAEIAIDSGLTAGVTYRYGAYAYDTSLNFASGAVAEVTINSVCGDSLCTLLEDSLSCSVDCEISPVSVCGNAICEADESPASCSADCGAPPGTACGDGICEAGETSESCLNDCPRAGVIPICGNAVCEADETADSCPGDCLVIEAPPTTVSGDERLDANDLHLLVANQAIELASRSGVYEALQGTVLWIRVRAESFLRAPAEIRFLLGNSAYMLAQDDNGYGAAIMTPNAAGTALAVLSVLYPDGQSDRIDFQVRVVGWGEVYAESNGAATGLSNILVSLFDESGGLWASESFGEENPTHTRSDGSFAWYAPNGYYAAQARNNEYREESRGVVVSNNIINPRIRLIPLPPPLIETLQDILTGEGSASEKILATGSLIGEMIDFGYGVAQNEVLDNPEVENASEYVAAPVVAAVATASAGAAASAIGLTTIVRFFFTQPVIFFTRRKRRAWGVVFNAITKVPIDLAVVRLYELTTGRLLQTRVTDREGRYFFITQPGVYRITVQKMSFIFPTKYLADAKHDPLFMDVYHGESIEVVSRDTTIAANIPVDPIIKEQVPAGVLRKIFWEKFQNIVSIISPILALVAVIIAPTKLTIGLFIFQVALYLIFHWIVRPKKPRGWGLVFDKHTKKPLGRAIVRIFEPIYGKLLEMQVTDKQGRYSFMVGPNKYRLASEKNGYEPAVTDLDYSEKKGPELVKEEIGLARGVKQAPKEDNEWQTEPV